MPLVGTMGGRRPERPGVSPTRLDWKGFPMKALFVLTAGIALAAWAVAVAAAPTPAAPATPPPADGPAFTKVSGPFTSGNLTVFLLHGPDAAPGLNVLTLQEAIEQKKVIVHETSEVNALSVENV